MTNSIFSPTSPLRTGLRRSRLLHAGFGAALIAGAGLLAAPVRAEDPWRGLDLAPAPGEIETPAAMGAPQPAFAEPDWSLLNDDAVPSAQASPRERRPAVVIGTDNSAWTSQDNNGASALSVKQSVTPFWDTRVGADLTVARQSTARSASDSYRSQFGDGTQTQNSGGAAWAAMTAPGVGSIWDKTSIEARVDPGADQSKLGTSLSKSVPLAGNQYSVTLQSGYNIIQQGGFPAIGYNGRPTRSYETDQLAKFNISNTGTSLLAGQSLATTDDKWLRKIGAEQKLFGGVNISGSISETVTGASNKTISAGFKHSW
jgi:hypothetical protein